VFRKLADNTDPGSLATRMRRRRFAFFVQLIDRFPGELRVLDVGGTPQFWAMMGLPEGRLRLTILNQGLEGDAGHCDMVIGDARDMRDFRDREFDIAFSNSVIEHVGSFSDQRRMASEICRVAKRYFVQTPNRYFPVEPHFLVPGFQFLPRRVRAEMLVRRDLGWYKKAASYEAALEAVSAVRLLTGRELRTLFPEARLYRERFLGLTKSFIAYDGWPER